MEQLSLRPSALLLTTSSSPSLLLSSSSFYSSNPRRSILLPKLKRMQHPVPITRGASSSKPLCAHHLLQDAGATALVTGGAYCLVLLFDNLTQRNLIKQNLSRKIVHILSGLLFMLSWPFFSNSTEARYFAAFVPLLNCLRLVIHGLSLLPDEGLVKSVTREGNPKELLRGPLYYVLILISSAILFWRDSPVGVIALAMMCGGDGFADIMGRRFGSLKIPYNQQKSLAGSASMFGFGFLISVVMLYYFSALGFFQLDWSSTVERVALVALIATIVESLPTTELTVLPLLKSQKGITRKINNSAARVCWKRRWFPVTFVLVLSLLKHDSFS